MSRCRLVTHINESRHVGKSGAVPLLFVRQCVWYAWVVPVTWSIHMCDMTHLLSERCYCWRDRAWYITTIFLFAITHINSWVMCEDVSWPDINVSGQHSFLAWHIYVSCNKKANHCHDTSISLTHGERAPRGRVAWLSCHTYGISPSHPCQISLLHPYKIPFDTYTNCMDTWHEWMQMLRYMHRSRVHGYADMDADKWRITCIHTYAYQYMWHMTRYICHAAMAHVTHDMIETWHSSLVTWHQYDCIMSHDTHSFNSHHLSLSRHLVTHSKMIMAR